ncbi:MAG: hypothetical protein NNA22_05730 [Nitrospira sp.]|nr:hypothetical protein [Nitrospira sp.]
MRSCVRPPEELLEEEEAVIGDEADAAYAALAKKPKSLQIGNPSLRTRKTSSTPPAVREPTAAYGGPGREIVLYQASYGLVQLDVRPERDTI